MMPQSASHNSDQSTPHQQTNAVESNEMMNGGAGEANEDATRQDVTERRSRQIEEHKRLSTEHMNEAIASKTCLHHGYGSELKYNDIIETLKLWKTMPVRDHGNIREGY